MIVLELYVARDLLVAINRKRKSGRGHVKITMIFKVWKDKAEGSVVRAINNCQKEITHRESCVADMNIVLTLATTINLYEVEQVIICMSSVSHDVD